MRTGFLLSQGYEHRHGVPLGLERCVLDVPEVFPVDVQRERPVAADLDPVEIVHSEERSGADAAAQYTRDRWDE
jgi:hypothetical protein